MEEGPNTRCCHATKFKVKVLDYYYSAGKDKRATLKRYPEIKERTFKRMKHEEAALRKRIAKGDGDRHRTSRKLVKYDKMGQLVANFCKCGKRTAQ